MGGEVITLRASKKTKIVMKNTSKFAPTFPQVFHDFLKFFKNYSPPRIHLGDPNKPEVSSKKEPLTEALRIFRKSRNPYKICFREDLPLLFPKETS